MSTPTTRQRPVGPIPAHHRTNFIHLYADIAWFGVLSGSAIAFMAVFAARQGATALQIGLLSAGPAVMNLLFTLPAGQWLKRQPISQAVFWTSVLHRFFYLGWVLLPLFLAPAGQVWGLILLTLLMSIPGTGLAVGFNALFAAAVPAEWRGHVAGTRNALLSITFIFTSLISGYILTRWSGEFGYQIVFTIGFVGAAMSSLHLWFVRPQVAAEQPPSTGRSLGDMAGPGWRGWGDGIRTTVGLRFLTRNGKRPFLLPNIDIWRGPFAPILGLLFGFHLAQFLAIPIFPLHWVDVLQLTDQAIGYGTAVFYLAVLIGSTQLAQLTDRFGNKRLMALGTFTMGLYPVLLAVSHNLEMFLVTSAVGGLSWSIVGGAIANYILEKIPENERPEHLAWYNLVLNAAILFGSLGGPLLANQVGLINALWIAAAARGLVALGLWKWG
jgi:MFS family permease